MERKYVSRAGYKLEGAAKTFGVDFREKVVLDVGSSTGGFTDYALQRGARKVVAVEKGTKQMNPVLAADPRVELHEKTDIFDFAIPAEVEVIMIDASFISLMPILEYLRRSAPKKIEVLAMLKPQFEASRGDLRNGVVKNSAIRRRIIREFEERIKQEYVIMAKRDNELMGAKGNEERFYKLHMI